jgi:hypothetical protein
MKRILSLIGVVLVVGCGGPEPRDRGTLQEVDGVYMNPMDGQPYSGPVFQMFGDGSRMTGTYKDGERDGPYEEYYENGQLTEKGTYKDGERDGPFEWYHENGQLMSRGTFSNGETDGPYENYHGNGQLSSKGTRKDGKLDGPFESYHENGQLVWKGTYNMGEECGEWIEEGETVTYPPCPPGLEDGN